MKDFVQKAKTSLHAMHFLFSGLNIEHIGPRGDIKSALGNVLIKVYFLYKLHLYSFNLRSFCINMKDIYK